jgi:hypothetical protein
MSLVSLYDEASLWMTPSTAKDGKLFSELPTDGSGDFTFSRGSNLAATRVGPDGLIEKGRENLFTYSQDFKDAAGWLVSSVTKASVNEPDPNGGLTAANITWTAGSSRFFYKNITQGNLLTESFYIKSNGGGNKFRFFGDGATDFSQDFTATSEWQRFEFFFERGSGQGTGITNASDNSAADLLIAFGQLEQGLVATEYIESGATTGKAGLLEDEPRLDYSGGATCPSLLLEPQRTNLVEYSEVFNLNWLASGRPAVETNIIDSPEGVQNGSRLTYGAGNVLRYQDELTFTNGYSYSIFVKKDVGRYVTIYAAFFTTSATIGFDLDEGTCQEGGVIEPYEDGWYRISVSKSVSGDADKSGYFYLYSTDTLGGITSTPGNKLYVYGAQIEEGSYPTSYIPNHSGGSITRGADDCKVEDLQSNGIVGNTWTYFFEWGRYVAERNFEMKNSLGSNFLFMVARMFRYNNNNGGVSTLTTLPSGVNERIKVAVRYNGNSLKVFRSDDITNEVTDMNASQFDDFDLLRLDRGNPDTEEFKQLLIFPTALTDSECIKLTTL